MYTSKKLLLISDKKAKSKCAKCLNGRTFLEKINDEYDLEQLIKNFFICWCMLYKNMETYCVKCRKKNENIHPKIFKTKNGRLIIQSKCSECGLSQELLKNKKQTDYWVI